MALVPGWLLPSWSTPHGKATLVDAQESLVTELSWRRGFGFLPWQMFLQEELKGHTQKLRRELSSGLHWVERG